MKIDGNTKISKIIKENSEAIEVIASLNHHFTKLRNPILRRVLAPRVNVREAAKIGKVTPELMLEKLAEIGFEVDYAADNTAETTIDTSAEQAAFIGKMEVVAIDVRPYLDRNEDPLLLLQNELKKLSDNQLLEVIINFEPIPLIHLQEKKGYKTLTIIDDEGVYHTYFKAGEKVEASSNDNPEELYQKVSTEEYEKLLADFPGEIITLDVRMLEMPGPMIAVLEAVENLQDNQAIKVFHKKIPQHLLPELQPKKLKVYIDYIEEGNVMIFIKK